MFFSAASVAGAFSGLLAYAIAVGSSFNCLIDILANTLT
jgi:hypothetical protein